MEGEFPWLPHFKTQILLSGPCAFHFISFQHKLEEIVKGSRAFVTGDRYLNSCHLSTNNALILQGKIRC